MRRAFLLLTLACLLATPLLSSHFLGGYINVWQQSATRVSVSAITWTDVGPAGGDRCNVTLECWNAGGTIKIAEWLAPRINGGLTDSLGLTPCDSGIAMGEYIRGTIKRNVYEIIFDFPGPGTYLFRCREETWAENIVNMDSSGIQSAFMETSFTVPSFLSLHASPFVENDTAFRACLGGSWSGDLQWSFSGDTLEVEAVPILYGTPWRQTTSPDSLGGGFFYVGPNGNPNWLMPAQPGLYAYSLHVSNFWMGVRRSSTRLLRVVEVVPGACAVSQDPQADMLAFSVYPNPATDHATVRAMGTVSLTDALGQVLYQAVVQGQHTIPLHHLPAGIYALSCSSLPGQVLRLVLTR